MSSKIKRKNVAIQPDVIRNLNRLKLEYLDDEEDIFISYSDVIKRLIKDSGKWKKSKSTSGRKKRESKD